MHRSLLLDLDDETLQIIRRNAAYNKAVTKKVQDRTATDIDLLVAKAATLKYVRESRMSDEAVRELCRVCTYMRLYTNACVVARGTRVNALYIMLSGQGARPAPCCVRACARVRWVSVTPRCAQRRAGRRSKARTS